MIQISEGETHKRQKYKLQHRRLESLTTLSKAVQQCSYQQPFICIEIAHFHDVHDVHGFLEQTQVSIKFIHHTSVYSLVSRPY